MWSSKIKNIITGKTKGTRSSEEDLQRYSLNDIEPEAFKDENNKTTFHGCRKYLLAVRRVILTTWSPHDGRKYFTPDRRQTLTTTCFHLLGILSLGKKQNNVNLLGKKEIILRKKNFEHSTCELKKKLNKKFSLLGKIIPKSEKKWGKQYEFKARILKILLIFLRTITSHIHQKWVKFPLMIKNKKPLRKKVKIVRKKTFEHSPKWVLRKILT